MNQLRGKVVGRQSKGGGQLKHTSLYELKADDGRRVVCDYIEIASDGFRTLAIGEEVWLSVSSDDPGWAEYVIPIRSYTPRQLLGLPALADEEDEDDSFSALWL